MGLGTPAATVAMQARCYMHEYGAILRTSPRSRLSLTMNIPTNLAAFFYEKPDREDHQVCGPDPQNLLDCEGDRDPLVARAGGHPYGWRTPQRHRRPVP